MLIASWEMSMVSRLLLSCNVKDLFLLLCCLASITLLLQNTLLSVNIGGKVIVLLFGM